MDSGRGPFLMKTNQTKNHKNSNENHKNSRENHVFGRIAFVVFYGK